MSEAGVRARAQRAHEETYKYKKTEPNQMGPEAAGTAFDAPARFTAIDEHDTKEELKAQLIKDGAAGTGATKLGMAMLTDEDLNIRLEKRKRIEAYSQQLYAASLFNLNYPAEVRIF